MSQSKKVAIVTGGGRGIGAAIAQRLAADGFAVVINYASNSQAAQAVLASIEKDGGSGMLFQADVANAAEVENMLEAAETALGGIDVVVNNAGVMHTAPLAEVSEETLDRVIAVNLKGSINLMRAAEKRLRKGGRIINFSSSLAGLRQPGTGIYTATKAGIEALTLIFAKELRGRNITVNAVAPGPTATDLFFEGKSDALVQQLAMAPPLERLGEPQDTANVVSFLAGPDSQWVNGQVVGANGGIV